MSRHTSPGFPSPDPLLNEGEAGRRFRLERPAVVDAAGALAGVTDRPTPLRPDPRKGRVGGAGHETIRGAEGLRLTARHDGRACAKVETAPGGTAPRGWVRHEVF